MPRQSAFFPTGVYRSVAYKPHRSGGMLIQFFRERLQVYCVYPDRMPRAAEKTRSWPRWKPTRGNWELDLGTMSARAHRHRRERELARVLGREYGPHPQLDAQEHFLALFEPDHLSFLEPFGGGAWSLYVGIRHCPGLFELAQGGNQTEGRAGDAALAFALSFLWLLDETRPTHPLRTVRRLLTRRRRDIAIRLGFASSANLSAHHVLGRISKRSLNPHNLKELRDVLRRGDRRTHRLLAHVQRINAGVIELLAHQNLTGHVSPSLLHEIGQSSRYDYSTGNIGGLLRDTVEMADLRGRRLPVLRSLQHLQQLHDEEMVRRPAWRHIAWGVGRRAVANAPLPPAPVEERPGLIEYVSSSLSAIEAEGRSMSNCVGHYGPRVARGECYIYRVLQPERCTLSIGPHKHGRGYRVLELRLAHNEEPAAETMNVVDRWLASSKVLRHGVDAVHTHALSFSRRGGNRLLERDMPF